MYCVYIFSSDFMVMLFNAQAARLRKLNSTPFASLKKFPTDFFNPYINVGTEPNDVPYELTGVKKYN